jgi:hypothetical protein
MSVKLKISPAQASEVSALDARIAKQSVFIIVSISDHKHVENLAPKKRNNGRATPANLILIHRSLSTRSGLFGEIYSGDKGIQPISNTVTQQNRGKAVYVFKPISCLYSAVAEDDAGFIRSSQRCQGSNQPEGHSSDQL